ncbi:G protein-coupled receptor GPR1 [Paramyrothecium foliicola]|nr:G protein-coupled receptor GPR1 [Paramyrothecium foliicola]
MGILEPSVFQHSVREFHDGHGHDLHGRPSAQIRGLQIASLTLASISVVFAIFSHCWFLRMKRSFRHDLIMLLIQSDLLKALWLMIFPIYELVNGPVKSSSAFCQASGFFLTLGIEASDVAVLLIAIHTGLYIFRGGSGLYPYRRYAYTGFIVTPLFLTFLAFINKPAFVNTGEFCYLPTKPDWSRQALSWVPRYIIFVAILLTYGYIYIYVTGLMNKFSAVGKSRDAEYRNLGRRRLRRKGTSTLPQTPQISYHGLIPSTPLSEASSYGRAGRQDSVSTLGSVYLSQETRRQSLVVDDGLDIGTIEQGVEWNIPNFSRPRASTYNCDMLELDPRNIATKQDQTTIKTPPQSHTGSPEPSPTSSISITKLAQNSKPERSFWTRSRTTSSAVRSRSTSLPNILAMLRSGPRSSVSSTSTALPPPLFESTGMTETRTKIRRQLRQLFIYPLVYLAVWFIPFVSHIKGEDSNGSPHVLAMVSLLSLCFQGTANALVFSVKEKPWRHPGRHTKGCHWRSWSKYNGQEYVNPNVGRTREEMLVDGRIARRRRDEELAERQLQHLTRRRTNRDWWECLQDSVDDLEDLNHLVERAT